jgi:hypothetical protein
LSDRYPCRVYEGQIILVSGQAADINCVVHAASIVSNMEFMHTPCGKRAGAGGIFEAPRDSLITCVRCIAALFEKGDRWT